MQNNVYIYILIMAGVSFVIRTLPLTLIRRPIRSKFIKSFLYYVPYVTLSVMTFPAILTATQSPVAGIAALLLGIVAAYFNAGLLKVAACCCSVVIILELFLIK